MSVFTSSPSSSSSSSFICIIITIMFCRSLLLVLLVLVCLQSITTFLNANGLDRCCSRYQTHPIPVRCITAYEETDHHCPKPGVIFTVQHGHPVCANPTDRWVQKVIDEIDSHSFTSWVKPEGG
ncbi:C-C motif chemokine 18 [Ictalurus punctatus]|uniref:C-C motif chemokine 18 n=1 Tax=Ictalurus punctatus TaxID=7998 RepID=A0A1V0JI29_ICTPU|nr:C-C motif chemokine 18 [Ictalurus punctatus]ARD08892.1 chemokine (C-C motif) ligand 36, duplicate 15 protein [Ictalurus punctatus]